MCITISKMFMAMIVLYSTHTQLLLAKTVSFTASTNCSIVGDGMHIRSAPICIRKPFSSGRKRSILPSCLRYAFKPSNNPYIREAEKYILHQTNTPFGTQISSIVLFRSKAIQQTEQWKIKSSICLNLAIV